MATFISALSVARSFSVEDLLQRAAASGRRINCVYVGRYIHNTRLDYLVRNLGASTNAVSTQYINTRYGFGGGFFSDYTDMSAGSDGIFHAFWTDTNNVQNVVVDGLEFTPTIIHQQDVVTGSGNF